MPQKLRNLDADWAHLRFTIAFGRGILLSLLGIEVLPFGLKMSAVN